MRNSCKVLFYIKRSRPLRNGLVPIMGRVTINGRRCQFSTRLSIAPSAWDVAQNRAIGRSGEMLRINRELDAMRFGLEKCYDELAKGQRAITAVEVRDRYLAEGRCREGLIALFRRHNEQFSLQVGVSRSRSTLYKYRSVLRHLETFLSSHLHRHEVSLNEVDRLFVAEFHAFLMRDNRHHKNTAWVYLTALKHLLHWARRQGLFTHDPFADYRLHSEYVIRTCLTDDELQRLMQLDNLSPSLRLVRDAFLFSCFTGLSYIDLKGLTTDQLTTFGGHRWIETTRHKTGSPVQVRLLDVALDILRKYAPDGHEGVIFPLPGNSWCNRCLGRLMQMARIAKPVTFHAARHTFATTLALSNGMPIEAISKLLGHQSIRTTQLYAVITRSQLDREMNRLSEQLGWLSVRGEA